MDKWNQRDLILHAYNKWKGVNLGTVCLADFAWDIWAVIEKIANEADDYDPPMTREKILRLADSQTGITDCLRGINPKRGKL